MSLPSASPKVRPLSMYDENKNCTLRSYRSLNSLNKIDHLNPLAFLEEKVSVKSQYASDFRRFHVTLGPGIEVPSVDDFKKHVYEIHRLTPEQRKTTTLCYTGKDGSSLPISNDENLRKALSCRGTLRIVVKNKGESLEDEFGYGMVSEQMSRRRKNISISQPQNFRRVSAIIDVDSLPLELRRVQLCRDNINPSQKLGLYIRDGTSVRLSQWGPVPVPGIFISRLVPGGLAASTNLLNPGDEILEVNQIDISGKSLDQVTDIMTANASCLILTTRPTHNNTSTMGSRTLPHMMGPFGQQPGSFSSPMGAYGPPMGSYGSPMRPFGSTAGPFGSPSGPFGSAIVHNPPFAPPPYCHPLQGYYHGYGSLTRDGMVPPCYSNLSNYTPENHEDGFAPSPWQTYSRESTYRLSEKLSNLGLARDRRRPFSVHSPVMGPNAFRHIYH